MTFELILSIVVNLSAIAFFAGTLKSTQEYQKRMIDNLQKEFEKNFKRLEEKQDKHNTLIERMYKVEGCINVLNEKLDVANHRINDLEEFQQY